MPITVAGVPASRKAPGILLNVILGGPGTSAGAAERRLLLLGNMIPAALGGGSASPAFAVAAGTHQTGGVPLTQTVRVFSEDHARQLFGSGSELHTMAAAALLQYPAAPLYAAPVLEAAGARSDLAIFVSLTGANPTASGTLRLTIAGERVEVNFTTTDTLATLLTNITNAILNVTTLPVTAQFGAGPVSPVTLTAKNLGTRGNLITVRGVLIVGSQELEVPGLAGAVAPVPPANVATLGGVNIGLYRTNNGTTTARYMTAGAGSDAASLGTLLALIDKERWHLIAVSAVDGAAANDSLDRLKTWLNSQAAPTRGIRQQAVAAQVTLLTASLGQTPMTPSYFINTPRMQLVLHPRAQETPCVIAAQVAACRLNGDVETGGSLPGEAADPAANLDAMRLVSIKLQPFDGDRLAPDDPDTALNNGLTALVASASRAGFTEISRSITSRWRDDTGAPHYGVLDASDVTVTDFVADRIVQNFANTFKGYRLAPDGNDPPRTERTTQPILVRAWLHSELRAEEEEGHIVEVDARMPLLKVEAQVGSAWRLNAEIPVVPIPGLHVFAANVRQLSARL